MRLAVGPPEAGSLFFRQPGFVSSELLGDDIQGAPSISLSSELNRANEILEGLYFSPAPDFYGSVALAVDVNDGGASGQGNVLSASSTISIDVAPVNDPPDIGVLGVHHRSGGHGPLRIEDINITDVDGTDGESFALSILADQGSVSIDPSSRVSIESVPSEEGTSITGVRIAGLLPDIRRALSHVWFLLPSDGWEGGSTLRFSATDGQGATGTAESLVVVLDPDVEPTVTAASDMLAVDQGIGSPLAGLSVGDLVAETAISAGLPSPEFNVTVEVEAGGVGLFPVPPGLSPIPGSETAEKAPAAVLAGEGLAGIFGTPRTTLSFRGTLPAVNEGLKAVTYTSASGTVGLGNHSVTVEVTRRGKLRKHSSRHQLMVDVKPVNQPPLIHWDTAVSEPELPDDGGFSLRRLSVTDSDLADDGLLGVQIQALAEGDGIAVRSAGNGLSFSQGSADGVPSSSIAFSGNMTSVMEAISSSSIALHAPGAPRSLMPALRVTAVDDHGGETSRVIEFSGGHANSAPGVTIETPRMLMKESGVLERVGELAGLAIHDADVDDLSDGFLEVNVSVSHRAVLEVQNITTSATSIHPVQTITTASSGGSNSTVGGTFNLTLDLTNLCDDCGFEETGPIWHDAVGNEDSVRVGFGYGSETGESVQAKLEDLSSLQSLGITVFCQRLTSLSSQGGREWRVTFLNAPASFPTMRAVGDSLTGDDPSVEVAYAMKGNSLSGSFAVSFGGYRTEGVRYDATAADLATALEGLTSVTAVAVTASYSPDPQGGRQWSVTFINALGEGGDLPLVGVDGQALGGRGAAVRAEEVVRGEGTAELWEVVTSAAHHNFVTIITMTGASNAKGYFQLGLTYGGRQAWTRPIYPQAVGSVSDEGGSSWSFGGVPGTKRGESVEARLLSLENWGELGPDAQVMVKRVESGDEDAVEWSLTFIGAPEDLEMPSIQSAHLTGGGTVSAVTAGAHNRIQGFFSLAYAGAVTPPLAHDISGLEMAAALNALQPLHSSDVETGIVAVTRLHETTLVGGQRWSVAFISDPETPGNLTAAGTSNTGLTGASARASAALVRRGGRGAVLRLVDLGGVAFGLPGYTTGEHLTVRGKPEMVTGALSSLSYSPRRGWNGITDIIFRAYDGGFSGIGGPQSGGGKISIAVQAVDTPPELLWCGNVLDPGGAQIKGVDEDAPFRFVDYDCNGGGVLVTSTIFDHIDLGGPDPGMQIHDPDGGASIIQVRQINTTYCTMLNLARLGPLVTYDSIFLVPRKPYEHGT